jgi:leader peptidase (prepilin peptidase)/N-methyltransferase
MGNMTSPLIEIAVLVFGLCIGSFLNVCIYRIPLNKSIVYPRSGCPHCGALIPWYDNIPLISYLLIKGRCRHCRGTVSFRYPFVELLSASIALLMLFKFGFTVSALVYYTFAAVLLVVTFIDIDHRIIPDLISLPGILVFFFAAMLVPAIRFTDSILGILAGGGSLFLVAWVYSLVTKKEGMGGGDIKFLAMIGALVGWKGVLFTIFVASTVGTVIGIVIMIATRKNMKLALPFGPFLALGAFTYIIFGPQLIFWYANLLR